MEKDEDSDGLNDVVGFCFLWWYWIYESWFFVLRISFWVWVGVLIGRERIRVIEYLKFDWKLYGGDDDDDCDGFWWEVREVWREEEEELVVVVRWRDVRGKWRERDDEREIEL